MLSAHLIKQLRDFQLDVDFTVHPGEVLVLLGENGAGKSTILNLLAGLLPLDDGRIILHGRSLFCSVSTVSCPPEDRRIGYVFQNYALFPHMTAFENIAFGLRMRKLSPDQIIANVRQILDDLGIAHLENEQVTTLSGGQRQRVALARALIIKPHLLLLDEPLAALDQRSREKIRIELREQLVKSNRPAILVTHSMKDARIIGDRVLVLAQGKVVWSGRPDELQPGSGIPLTRD